MAADIRSQKAALRAEALGRRNLLAPEAVSAWSAGITESLMALPLFTAAETIAGYMAIRNEVLTRDLLQAALAQGKRVALPRTIPRERRLALHEVATLHDLVAGPYGILEPAATLPEISPAEVQLFLVPGLAVDAAGNRLGYGAGYYDRVLAGSRGWRVALAYISQLALHIPAALHDLRMDLIATEAGMIDCRQGQAASDHLRLRNMTFYGHHGAFPQEREAGIRLAIDADLRLDLQIPGLSDDLAGTVNYPQVYQLIERIQTAHEFALFEALVEHIAGAILRAFPQVCEVTLTARKFHPPVGGLLDAFEVEISRSRPPWMAQLPPLAPERS